MTALALALAEWADSLQPAPATWHWPTGRCGTRSRWRSPRAAIR